MSTIQKLTADRTRQAAQDLIFATSRVPAERQTWQPLGDSRYVLDMIQECAHVNDRWAQMLRRDEWYINTREEVEAYNAAILDMPSALQMLKDSAERFAQAVEGLSDARLSDDFVTPWRTAKVGQWIFHAIWHMSYHEGQIQYIQTLYGDWEM